MKEILIMRHAKSDWNTDSSDFERTLNKRGLKAAKTMGEEVLKRKLVPDFILTSPAKRAVKTFQLFTKACNYSGDVAEVRDFYFTGVTEAFKHLIKLDDKYNRVLLLGHNPTWEQLSESLISVNTTIAMPTASVVYITAKIESWKDLKLNENKLEWLLSPKMITT